MEKRFTYTMEQTETIYNQKVVFNLYVKEKNPVSIRTQDGFTEVIYEPKKDKWVFSGCLSDCKIYIELHEKSIILK